MTAHTVTEPHFTGLTIRDQRGATLTIERNSNATAAWIAPPGSSDGFSVILDDADQRQLIAFLGGDLAKVAAERDRLYEMYAASQQALRSLAQAYADTTGKPTAVRVDA